MLKRFIVVLLAVTCATSLAAFSLPGSQVGLSVGAMVLGGAPPIPPSGDPPPSYAPSQTFWPGFTGESFVLLRFSDFLAVRQSLCFGASNLIGHQLDTNVDFVIHYLLSLHLRGYSPNEPVFFEIGREGGYSYYRSWEYWNNSWTNGYEWQGYGRWSAILGFKTANLGMNVSSEVRLRSGFEYYDDTFHLENVAIEWSLLYG